MTKKVFAEIGFGNNHFISTEIEKGKKEYRLNKFIKPNKINGYYLRVWILKRVLVLSTYDGIKSIKKPKNKFKILFGIQGVD